MKVITLRDGTRILLLEQKDLDRTLGVIHDQTVRKSLDVARAGLIYVVVALLAVICGMRDWSQNGDRTGYVSDARTGKLNEELTEGLLVRMGERFI